MLCRTFTARDSDEHRFSSVLASSALAWARLTNSLIWDMELSRFASYDGVYKVMKVCIEEASGLKHKG